MRPLPLRTPRARWHTRFPLLALLASVAACATGGADVREFDDPDSPVEVAAGDDFRLSVGSNHSTGYRWLLVDSSALAPLELVETTYVERNPRVDGGGGTERWHFRAAAPGEGTVRLEYRRPWEDEAPVRTRTYVVRVR